MKKTFLKFYIMTTMLFISIVPTFATTNVTSIGTTNVPVDAEIASTFTVSVPKTINIKNETTTYDISISGDLASNEILNVIPASTFKLSEINGDKASLECNVTQSKTSFEYEEIVDGININGFISIEGRLSAGKWTGTLPFEINISFKEIIEEPISIQIYYESLINEPDADTNMILEPKKSVKELVERGIFIGWTCTHDKINYDEKTLYKLEKENDYNNQFQKIDIQQPFVANGEYIFLTDEETKNEAEFLIANITVKTKFKMPWRDWIASEYNTLDLYIEDGKIKRDAKNGKETLQDYFKEDISPDDIINIENEYELNV